MQDGINVIGKKVNLMDPLFPQLNMLHDSLGDYNKDAVLKTLATHISEFQVLEAQIIDDTFVLGKPQDNPDAVLPFLMSMVANIIAQIHYLAEEDPDPKEQAKAHEQ